MECPFIATCRPHRDYRISLGAELREDDGNEMAFHFTERLEASPAPFAGVAIPDECALPIEVGEIGKVKAMNIEISLPLRLIPYDLHGILQAFFRITNKFIFSKPL